MTPHFKQQTDYTCGPACMRMALGALGMRRSEQALAKSLKTTKRYGTKIASFPILAEKLGLHYLVKRLASIKDLSSAQKDGYILILLYWLPDLREEHYAVLKKIDKHYIYLNDPWYGPRHRYSIKVFQRLWKKTKLRREARWFFGLKK